MKKRNLIFPFLLLGLFNINQIVPIHAVSTQWFPHAGTVIEYDLTNSLTLLDNSRTESDTFNIYNNSGYMTFVPTLMDSIYPEMPTSFVLMMSDVKVSFLVNYTEKSNTELYRNTRLKLDDVIYDNIDIRLIKFRDLSSQWVKWFSISSNTRFVDKSNFFTDAFWEFLDFFDCTLGSGANVIYDVNILSATPDHIVAASLSLTVNETYIANTNGKVKTYHMSFYLPNMLTNGFRKTNYIFTARESTSNGIFGYDLYLIIGLIGILTILLIRKSKSLTINS